MLVLSRKVGEKIVLPNCEVEITVTAVRGNNVCLGFTAPPHVSVHREEVWLRISHGEEPAAARGHHNRLTPLHRRLAGVPARP